MTAKPETAAEVLAESIKTAIGHEKESGEFSRSDVLLLLSSAQDAVDALSAQGEAGPAAYCRACQAVGMSNCGQFNECSGATCITCHRPLNPAPARVISPEICIVCEWSGDTARFVEAEVGGKSVAFPWRDRSDGLKELVVSTAPARVTEEIMRDRMNGLRDLCGYVEDGSSQTISIGQDDVTKEWAIRRGGKILGFGATMAAAIDAALEDGRHG